MAVKKIIFIIERVSNLTGTKYIKLTFGSENRINNKILVLPKPR